MLLPTAEAQTDPYLSIVEDEEEGEEEEDLVVDQEAGSTGVLLIFIIYLNDSIAY